MNRATRNALASAVLQLALLVFVFYLGFSADAFPGAPVVARAGLVALALSVIYLLVEVERLKAQVRTLTVLTAGALGGGLPRNDRAAIDVLVRALSSEDSTVREKAHKNLRRITGQELPLDPEAWRSWWASAREGFQGRGGPRP